MKRYGVLFILIGFLLFQPMAAMAGVRWIKTDVGGMA